MLLLVLLSPVALGFPKHELRTRKEIMNYLHEQQMEKSGFEYRSELWDADYEDEEDIMEEEIEDEIYKGME